MTKKEIAKQINNALKTINDQTKLLKALYKISSLNRDLDKIQFEKTLKQNLKQENLGLDDDDVERIIDVANIMAEQGKKDPIKK